MNKKQIATAIKVSPSTISRELKRMWSKLSLPTMVWNLLHMRR